MADVTGPISTLPGAIHVVPNNVMCDEHPDRPATRRVQGETDSFGSEMHDMCECCYAEYVKAIKDADHSGTCEWCKSYANHLFNRRDIDEGMSGRVYQVCRPCIDKDNARINEELESSCSDDDFYIQDDDDDHILEDIAAWEEELKEEHDRMIALQSLEERLIAHKWKCLNPEIQDGRIYTHRLKSGRSAFVQFYYTPGYHTFERSSPFKSELTRMLMSGWKYSRDSGALSIYIKRGKYRLYHAVVHSEMQSIQYIRDV